MQMTPQDSINYIWWAWLISWFATAIWSDRAATRPSLRLQAAYRLTTICGALLLFGWVGIRRYDIRFWRLDGRMGWLFVLIAAAGVIFMWWARLHLGRLWSASVTRKADHHIIDTGPYGIVRHPIYSGVIFSVVATAIVQSTIAALLGAALILLGF